jgi:hypothetical protein
MTDDARPEDTPGEEEAQQATPLPEPSFTMLAFLLSSQALAHLGQAPDGQPTEPNLDSGEVHDRPAGRPRGEDEGQPGRGRAGVPEADPVRSADAVRGGEQGERWLANSRSTVPGTVRQALLAVGHALRGVRPAGFAAVARLRALPSAGSGTPFGLRRPRCAGFAPPASPPWPGSGPCPPPASGTPFGPRRPRCARGSPRRLRRRGPAPGRALRRLGNPAEAGSVGPTGVRGVRPAGFAAVARLRALPSAGSGTPFGASSATVCAGFAPPASPPWPGSGLRPPPAREPRSGGWGIRRPRVRGVRPAGFAAVARLRAFALRRLGNPVRASSATVCAGFAPPASPPWPGSGPCPPPAREPRGRRTTEPGTLHQAERPAW